MYYMPKIKRKCCDEIWHSDLTEKACEFYDDQDIVNLVYCDDWNENDEIVRTYYAVDPHNWEIVREFETLNGVNEWLENWTDELAEVFF